MSSNQFTGNPFDLLLQEIRELKSLIQDNEQKKAIQETPYLKIDAAAAFLSTTVGALRLMAHKNQLPYIKKQGKLWFRQNDLIAWLEEGSVLRQNLNAETILLRSNGKGGASHV